MASWSFTCAQSKKFIKQPFSLAVPLSCHHKVLLDRSCEHSSFRSALICVVIASLVMSQRCGGQQRRRHRLQLFSTLCPVSLLCSDFSYPILSFLGKKLDGRKRPPFSSRRMHTSGQFLPAGCQVDSPFFTSVQD